MLDIGKIGEWEWIVNTDDMTCRNPENEIVIKMENVNGKLKAVLHYMPMELFAEISGYSNGEKIIKEIVKKAREKCLSFETYPA